MVFVHIVLFKVKPQVLNNGLEEFKARLETLRDLQVVKEEVKQLKFGPPIWDNRAHGFNYGLYTVFDTREGLVRYKEDNDHKEYVYDADGSFSKMILLPNVDGGWCTLTQMFLRTTLRRNSSVCRLQIYRNCMESHCLRISNAQSVGRSGRVIKAGRRLCPWGEDRQSHVLGYGTLTAPHSAYIYSIHYGKAGTLAAVAPGARWTRSRSVTSASVVGRALGDPGPRDTQPTRARASCNERFRGRRCGELTTWSMPLPKRAISAHDVWRSDADNQGLARVSSAYDAIPNDIQARLQSMGWRIRSNVSRGYLGATAAPTVQDVGSADFQTANSTLENVKSTYNQWGRTASVPHGALRGTTAMPPPPPPNMLSRWSSDTDTANSSFSATVPTLSLKRGMGEDDSDAILADAFADGDGSLNTSWDAPMGPGEDTAPCMDDPSLQGLRPMRPLPARGPFRATLSMPVEPRSLSWRDTRQDMDMADEDASERFRHIDFSAYAANPDGF